MYLSDSVCAVTFFLFLVSCLGVCMLISVPTSRCCVFAVAVMSSDGAGTKPRLHHVRAAVFLLVAAGPDTDCSSLLPHRIEGWSLCLSVCLLVCIMSETLVTGFSPWYIFLIV